LSFVLTFGSWTSIRFEPTGRIRGSATPSELMRVLMISIAELEPRLRAVEQVLHQDVVALADVLERLLQADIREELAQVDLLLPADPLERHVLARGGPGLLELGRLLQERVKLGLVGRGVRPDVVGEGDVLPRGERQEREDGPAQDQEA
jgi:hypothetical protein